MAKGQNNLDEEAKSKLEQERLEQERLERERLEQEQRDRVEQESRRVEVICDGFLGQQLLQRGDVTDDPAYVALLETERGQLLVREVK